MEAEGCLLMSLFNKPRPFEGLNMRIPTRIPTKEGGVLIRVHIRRVVGGVESV